MSTQLRMTIHKLVLRILGIISTIVTLVCGRVLPNTNPVSSLPTRAVEQISDHDVSLSTQSGYGQGKRGRVVKKSMSLIRVGLFLSSREFFYFNLF